MSLVEDVNRLCQDLQSAVTEMAKYGKKKSDAEHDYRIAVEQETLKERDEGTPVTLIEKIVNGKTADLRRERDINEAYWRTSMEKIQAIKKQIDTYNLQIDKEWKYDE